MALDTSDQIIRAVLYCDHSAADAEHPEERDQFLSLAHTERELPKRGQPVNLYFGSTICSYWHGLGFGGRGDFVVDVCPS
jgi:hypothetical protein